MNLTPRLLWIVCCLGGLCLFTPPASWAQTYSVDGMIGQVNGQAIYTRDVLDEQLQETLAGWGRELSRSEFRKRAAERIAVRLNSIVTDALIYGEARRDLSDQERQGLTMTMAPNARRCYDNTAKAHPRWRMPDLLRETGIGLDASLRRWRQALVVQRYMRQKLTPKVNVTRKSVKHYYKEHEDEFNPEPTRTVRVIQTQTGDDAQHILGLLQAGTPFAEAAADTRNQFRPDEGGMIGAMAGEQLFADPDVNAATLAMQAGEFAGPFTVGERDWFVGVEKIDHPPSRSLMDVQVQIQNMLSEQQLRDYTERYRLQLFEKGSYNSIEQMTLDLVEIAEDRYVRAEP